MKKIKMLVLILVMFLLSATICFAASSTEVENSIVQPMYVATQSHTETFTISTNGLAKMNVELAPFSKTTLDRVNVTLSIKSSSGTSIYNKSYDMTWNSVYARFKLTKEYQLHKNGTYEFQATYKCYKNNSLVETIKSNRFLKTY